MREPPTDYATLWAVCMGLAVIIMCGGAMIVMFLFDPVYGIYHR